MSNDTEKLKRLKFLSVLFDSKFQGPFGFRFGLDGLLGLIPFIGDLIGAGVSFYIVTEAAMLGASPSVLIRMGFNIFLENLIDVVPIFGNLFDFYWKANDMNITLLETHLASPRKATFSSRLVLILILSFLLGLLLLSFKLLILAWEMISDFF